MLHHASCGEWRRKAISMNETCCVCTRAAGLLARPELAREPERAAAAPVFFDVLGVAAVAVRAPAALLAAVGALALLLLRLHLTAVHARAQRTSRPLHAHPPPKCRVANVVSEPRFDLTVYMKRGEWARVVCGAGAAVGAGLAGGLGASAAMGALLHELGARLAFYSRPWLLVPLYALPAVCGCWGSARWTWSRAVGARGAAVRGWWRARACGEAVCAWGGLALAACAARGLRSGFVPFLWVRGVGRGGAGGSAAGRADVPRGRRWRAARRRTCARARCAWGEGGARCSYSAERPQRVLLFHTRRTDHARAPPSVEHFFWIPEIDANTPHSLAGYVEGVESARASGATDEAECARWVYCGAPYYLPVRRLIARGHSLPAREPPRTRLQAAARRQRLNATISALHLDIRGPQHVVVVVAPAAGARLAWTSALSGPLEGPRWGLRRTYFLSVHHARAPAHMHLELHIQVASTLQRLHSIAGADLQGQYKLHLQHEGVGEEGEEEKEVAQLSVAGHSLFGEDALSEEHQRLLARLPPWTAPFGWGVDLHLFAL
ncbi:hypothetical protein RR46_01393 [Papilio xuthus]|uniref:Endoplasmic reticulum metallopeptidase 1-like C-terminal domain-containing protein n=1 Tax=Papilio xuthus TaxID=66420 RepID=A0A0N0P9T1_PAPXU|nr:hypothetical protein RR46_01393 [Papilio xuthus]